MSDLLICAGDANLDGDNLDIRVKIIVGDGDWAHHVVFPISVLGTNANTFNNMIIDAVKALLLEQHGVTVEGGDKVNVLGGIVA
jgi:hypothetical protein